MKTYWMHDKRGFVNEYVVGVATTEAAAADYEAEGFRRVTRRVAEKAARYNGDAATEALVGYRIDGKPCYRDEWFAALTR